MRAGASHETVGLLSLNGSPHEINAVGLSVGGLHIPCHFHVHDVHEVHSCFDLIPLSSFVSAGLGELLHLAEACLLEAALLR